MSPSQRPRVAMEATALLGQPTGVGVAVAGMLGSLLDQPVDLSAFAISWRRRAGLAAAVPAGVTVRQRPMPARPLHAAWDRASLPPVEWFTGAADVVHGTNYVVPPTRRAARVVTVYDLTMVRFPELCQPSTLRFPALIARAVAEGAHVHVTASAIGDEVQDHFDVPSERLHHVPLGIPALPPASSTGLEAWPYILAVGTAEPRKDLPGLVAAFNEVAREQADVRLVHVGPDGWGSEDLEQAVRSSPYRDRIVRTGYVDDARLAALLAGATALAYPSRYEGFGFPPLQAMAAGTPVVASDTPVLRETVGEGGLLVPVADVPSLAAALSEVVGDDSKRAKLAEAGRVHAAAFTWRRCGEGLVATYRSAMGARS